jgi:outer membrane protein TolC
MPRNFPGVATATAALLAVALASPPATEAEQPPQESGAERTVPSADAVLAVLDGIGDPELAELAREVLDRNPDLAAARQRAEAAERVAPQVRSLPDPMAGLTAFLLTPETRVGPQNVMVSLSQRFPWFGKLDLRARRALYQAAAAHAEAESKALDLVTETRRLAYELSFLDEWREIVRTDRITLERYEELANTRYAAGIGLGQSVIKIQAEITKDETRLLQIADRRAVVAAQLNALRDRPAGATLPTVALPEPRDLSEPDSDPGTLLAELKRRAVAARPEIARADAEIAVAGTATDLADLERYPDVTVGLTYTQVGDREDEPGRVNPPPDDGDDILGLTASVNLPIWRDRIDAGIEEAMARRRATESSRRAVVAGIERSLGELTERLDLTWRQLRLFDDVLIIQAEESLSSAESAYTAGNLNALDLLDAERVLLDVRTSTARTRADWAIALARLEGAVGRPLGLRPMGTTGTHDEPSGDDSEGMDPDPGETREGVAR